MAKYLVTGGAGFIGSNTVDELIAGGSEVVVLDNLSEGKRENIAHHGDKITFIEGDIRDTDTLKKSMEEVDYILHLAALRSVPKSMDKPLEYNEVNVTATLSLLKVAKEAGVKRLVFASSSSIYGDTDKFPQEETDPAAPVSPYAASKLLSEEYCRLFTRAFDFETVCLRFFNVFGPRQSLESQYAVAVPKFVTCIMNDEAPPIYDDGLQSRDFTYVLNVAQALIQASIKETLTFLFKRFSIISSAGDSRISKTSFL